MKPLVFFPPYIKSRKYKRRTTLKPSKVSTSLDSSLVTLLGPIHFLASEAIAIDMTNTIWDIKAAKNTNLNASFKKKLYKDHRIILNYKLAAPSSYWPNYNGKYKEPKILLSTSVSELPGSAGKDMNLFTSVAIQTLLNIGLLINKSSKLKVFTSESTSLRKLKYTNRIAPVQVTALVEGTIVPIVNPWSIPDYKLLDEHFTYLVAAYSYLTRGFKVYTDLELNIGTAIKGYAIEPIRIKLLVPELKLAFLDPTQALALDSEIASLAVLKTVRNRLGTWFNIHWPSPFKHYRNLKFNAKYLCSWEQRQTYSELVETTNQTHDNKWMGVSPKSFVTLNSLPFIHYVPFNNLN
jgi:hypothetical protein